MKTLTKTETPRTHWTANISGKIGGLFKKTMAALLVAGTAAGGLLAAPERAQADDREVFGTLLGAGLGGLLGAQVGGGKGKLAAVAVGTLTGAVIGNNIAGNPAYANDRHVTHRPVYRPQPTYGHGKPVVHKHVTHKHVTHRHVYERPSYDYDRPRHKKVVKKVTHLPDGRTIVKRVVHLPNGQTIVKDRTVYHDYASGYDRGYDKRHQRKAAKKRAYAKGYYQGYEEGYGHGQEDYAYDR